MRVFSKTGHFSLMFEGSKWTVLTKTVPNMVSIIFENFTKHVSKVDFLDRL